MPTVPPGSKILVTGANGFVAVWLVRTLLERGYIVRGTVRSEDKVKFLKDLFRDYGAKFDLVIVGDMIADGAFDEAVKGVDAIEHVASPVHFSADDPQEIIEPAVKGTTEILKSVIKYGQDVKRVVITSSVAAIIRPVSSPIVLSERDWNEPAVKEVEEQGCSASAVIKYRASKVLAEKAAWNFYNQHSKSGISWDLVVINPPYVFGPIIHDVPNPSALGVSVGQWYETVVTGSQDPETTLGGSKGGIGWVDVRDLAEAHVRALQREEAAGERMIVSAGSFRYQLEWHDLVNSFDPSPIPSHPNLPKGNPGSSDKNYLYWCDSSKASRILGMLMGERIRYRSMEECARDTLADFEARKW
ncbi:NAD(P)-binding protein [Dendrothele bispora CBS 962.96]|uniref:NAD(P)-binding protein n=1 Tax=Dendrothele bispora (strain CBS 962.96) TaxID=1314807 RepID=A0A4S8LVZ4_DENBC|nr:NAD(P)-binding protein [Dendrothele bispora CBS 962.96]